MAGDTPVLSCSLSQGTEQVIEALINLISVEFEFEFTRVEEWILNMCAYAMDSFCHKEQSYTVFWGRDATGAHIKQNKPA